MALAVILELGGRITLGDIKRFVSYAPADMQDDDEVNCLSNWSTGQRYCLVIPLSDESWSAAGEAAPAECDVP